MFCEVCVTLYLINEVPVDAVWHLLDEGVHDEFEMRAGAGLLILLFYTNTPISYYYTRFS